MFRPLRVLIMTVVSGLLGASELAGQEAAANVLANPSFEKLESGVVVFPRADNGAA